MIFMSNIAHINEKSQEIIDNIKHKIYLTLFQHLSNEYGVIDGNKIEEMNLDEIPKKIKDLIIPILQDIRDCNETLTLEEFVVFLNECYNSFSFEQKQALIEWYLKSNKVRKSDTFGDIAELIFHVIFFIFFVSKNL